MKITFLGQAGLMLEHGGLTVMIDPYLSSSVERVNPSCYRRVAVDESFFGIRPDVMIFTHNHLDHYDPETVSRFIGADSAVTVLSPRSVWDEVRKLGGNNNYVMFNRLTTWTEKGITFTAVKAEHSDPTPIGVVIRDTDGKRYYITGDTLYNEEIFDDLSVTENTAIYALFLPVNGVGNNMNMTDAARFARRIGACHTVPIHTGMFDSLSSDDFDCDGKVVPTIYKEIIL
ncbi:MAG: MBL fold metallo-hydrolase [Clostridia bacterium]|nr:MBL fold metallo-hydrolase [Clostridia bacterium]